MNKIYKLKFSRLHQMMVALPESARAGGEQCKCVLLTASVVGFFAVHSDTVSAYTDPVAAGSVVTNETVTSGGLQEVYGTTSNVYVQGDGYQDILSGGLAVSTTLALGSNLQYAPGATQTVYQGGVAS